MGQNYQTPKRVDHILNMTDQFCGAIGGPISSAVLRPFLGWKRTWLRPQARVRMGMLQWTNRRTENYQLLTVCQKNWINPQESHQLDPNVKIVAYKKLQEWAYGLDFLPR
jgi:hypothetical protein